MTTTPQVASLRLLARRINDAEDLCARLRRACELAHGALVSGRKDEALQVLRRALQTADAYGDRR